MSTAGALGYKRAFRLVRQAVLRGLGRTLGKPFQIDFARVAIVAPHPDDEVFGCGGMLANLQSRGGVADVIFLTYGGGSHRSCCEIAEDRVAAERAKAAVKACTSLGVSSEHLHFLNGPDGGLPRRGQEGFKGLAEAMAGHLRELRVEAVFCPHLLEVWTDHIAAWELTQAAVGLLSHRPRIYSYCIWFWHNMSLHSVVGMNWRNARVLDIRSVAEKKREAMDIYLKALAPCGTPWIGKVPEELLQALSWGKELFFDADS